MDFFFNDTAATEIYTLSLHDALPILALATIACLARARRLVWARWDALAVLGFVASVISGMRAVNGYFVLPALGLTLSALGDRKSTRLNSSHANISYAVFCLKKKILSI